MSTREETKIVEFDKRKGAAQQEAELQRLRRQGWSVRSVELDPDGTKKVHLVRTRPPALPKPPDP